MNVTYHNELGQEREIPAFKSALEKPTRPCQLEKSYDIIQWRSEAEKRNESVSSESA